MNSFNDNSSRIPQNDPSKAMDSKKEVENSNDAKTDQDFPGYPHYPAKEDMMDHRTQSHRVDMDLENISGNPNPAAGQPLAGQNRKSAEQAMQPGLGNDDLDIEMGNEADVDEDDLAILNSTNAEIGVPQNISTEELTSDLDIPGAELDDENENIGEEDEENNYYSLGGDRHEAQEEDPYSDPVRE